MRTQRLAMVTSSGGTNSARTTKTVPGGGSSMVLSNAGPASFTRWKSLRTRTLRSPSIGLKAAARAMSRAESMLMYGPWRSTTTTSGWVPLRTRRHTSQVPSPPWGQRRAAAKAVAAACFPVPGGPTNR